MAKILMASLIIGAMLLLAACGGNGDQDTTPAFDMLTSPEPIQESDADDDRFSDIRDIDLAISFAMGLVHTNFLISNLGMSERIHNLNVQLDSPHYDEHIYTMRFILSVNDFADGAIESMERVNTDLPLPENYLQAHRKYLTMMTYLLEEASYFILTHIAFYQFFGLASDFWADANYFLEVFIDTWETIREVGEELLSLEWSAR